MTTTPPKGVGYGGWWRAGRKSAWTRIAVADGYDECWGALLDALQSVHGGDSVVLRLNTDPNLDAWQRRQVERAKHANRAGR